MFSDFVLDFILAVDDMKDSLFDLTTAWLDAYENIVMGDRLVSVFCNMQLTSIYFSGLVRMGAQ